MIDWLNDNSGAVQAISVAVLAVVTAVYAWRTWSISRATRNQAEATRVLAEATRDMVDATLCPVIEQWLPSDRLTNTVSVVYSNSGNGPAINIKWYLQCEDGTQMHSQRRVQMGTHSGNDSVQFPLEVSPGGSLPTVVAEYESVFGALWRSTLPLIQENGRLANGEPEVKRINERRE